MAVALQALARNVMQSRCLWNKTGKHQVLLFLKSGNDQEMTMIKLEIFIIFYIFRLF